MVTSKGSPPSPSSPGRALSPASPLTPLAALATHPVVQALVLAAVVLLAYLPSWRSRFLWDDDQMIMRETNLTGFEGLGRIWAGGGGPDFTPLTHTLFWLEWRLFGVVPAGFHGINGYHVVSIVLHCLAALLVWRVLQRLRVPWPWLGAALFALHPVNVSSVAWISETKNTLSLVLYAAAFLCFLRATDSPAGSVVGWRGWYVASFFVFLAALLAKASGVGLPLVMLGATWWRRRRLGFADLLEVLPFLVTAAVFALITVGFQHSRAMAGEAVQAEGLALRAVAAGPAFWFYLGKLLVPVDLMMIHPTWTPAVTAGTLVADGALLASLGLFWRFRATWARGAWFAGSSAFVLLLPVLGLVDMYFFQYSRVAEHFCYLASIPILALVAAGLSLAVARMAAGDPTRVRALAVIVALCLLGGCTALTVTRQAAFQDREAMWRDNLRRNPGAWTAHRDLGFVLAESGRAGEALGHYEAASALHPDDTDLEFNWGRALDLSGRAEEAALHYRRAIAIDPGNFRARGNLGAFLESRGRRDDARREYVTAVLLYPNHAEARNNLGNLLLADGRPVAAEVQYREAVRSSPLFADAHYNLGVCLERRGRADEALEQYSRAALLQPTHQKALLRVGLLLTRRGRYDAARIPLDRLLDLNSEHAPAWNALGELLMAQKRWVEAERVLIKALQVDKACTDALNNLGEIYRLQHRQAPQAMALFKAACEVDAGSVTALNNLAWLVATFPDDKWRGSLPGGLAGAVQASEEAARRTGRSDANILDTLAAVYARAGRWDEALRTAAEALALARKNSEPELEKGIQRRAASYGARQPWTDPEPSPSPAPSGAPAGPAK